MPGSTFLSRRFPIAAHLAIFGLCILLPAAAAGALVAYRLANAERDRLETVAQQFAQDLARDLDRELAAIAAPLIPLAASPAAAAGDFQSLHQQARTVAAETGLIIAVRDADGQQAMNTLVPWGEPLPRSVDPELRKTDRQALDGGRVMFSNLLTGAVTRSFLVLAAAPLAVNGARSHVISAAIPPDRIGAALRLKDGPADWILSVTDGVPRIVARSTGAERLVGTEPSATFKANTAANRRMWRGVTVDGQDVITVSERSSVAPWRVSVSVLRSALEEPLRRMLIGVAALTAAGLAGSLAFAFAYGRALSGPIRRVAAAAGELGSDKTPQPPSSTIAEVHAISRAISMTAEELRRRAAERDRALEAAEAGERRLRATYENAGVGIAEIDASGQFIAVNDALCRITGFSRSEMLAMRFTELSDDETLDLAQFQAQTAGAQSTYVAEKRFRRKDGEVRWIRLFSTAVDDTGAFAYAVRVVLDITEERRASAHQLLLIAELNHRVKNTLAVVQSLVQQTLKTAASPEQFRDALTGRIMALARSHEILSESEWKGATLETLLRATLQGHDGPDWTRTTFDGPPVRIGPRAVVSLSLMAHELATNATKYGALSTPQGRLAVTWEAEEPAGSLRLRWRETDPKAPGRSIGTGFGSKLIRLCVENELGGSYETAAGSHGFEMKATVPLETVRR